MSGIEIGALCVVGAFLLFAAVRLFRGPVKLALRVLVNSALGFGAVWLLNLTAAVTGSGGLDVDLAAVQDALGDQRSARRGDNGAIVFGFIGHSAFSSYSCG